MPVASTFGAVGGVSVDGSGGDQTLPRTARAFWVGGTGNLALTMDDGSALTFTAIPDGFLLPVQANVVKQTGTTATAVLALF